VSPEQAERWRRAAAALELREKASWEIEMEELRAVRRAERAAEAAKEAAKREAAKRIVAKMFDGGEAKEASNG
jgi:hypothetical protein